MQLTESNSIWNEGGRSVRHVFIRDLIIECTIGVHEQEHRSKQRLRMNLDLGIPETFPVVTDHIAEVVCYDEIIGKVSELLARRHFGLLEVAAEEIARLCLNDTRVQKVRISLEKLDVYKNAKSVGIEIWRSRL
jgi:dihydroneopterin aldolase